MTSFMQLFVITGFSSLLAITSAAASKTSELKCATSDGRPAQTVVLSKEMAQAKVLSTGSKDATQLAALDCVKVEGSPVDENGLVRLSECREPNKVDAGYVVIIHRNASGQIQLDLSGQSFAGPHLIGTLVCR